jgi:outer membrane protein assembly factor BamB
MVKHMQLANYRIAHLLVVSVGLAASGEIRAANWPQWRGPTNNCVSQETGIPTKFSKTENVAWRLPLPGQAGSTPIVWENRIFLTSADGNDLVLFCCSTDGKPLWKKVVASGNKAIRADEGNLASPSPSTDGKHVWCYFGTGDMACYDFAGNEVWKFNLQDRYKKFNFFWGMHVTPLLDGDRLYMSLIYTGSKQVVALDKNTGAEIWSAERPSDARAECEQSYASPIIYRDAKQEFLLTHGADYIVAHSLTDGSEIWRCGGLQVARYEPSLRFVASPTAIPGLIVVPSAKNHPVLGLSPDNHGDITAGDSGHIWTKSSGTPDVPCPLIYGGLVYLCDENGLLTCLDAQTGQEYYAKKRLHYQKHRASPVYADGKIYAAAHDGVVDVVKAGKEFEVLSSNEMGEDIASSPIISGGTLYIRTYDALYAIRAQGNAE